MKGSYGILVQVVLLFGIFPSLAQVEKQYDSTARNHAALISTDRVKLLNDIDVLANMQFNQYNRFANGNYSESNFAMNQFRLEIKGKVSDKVYFRFRDRYTRLPDPQSRDVISRSVDLAFIRVDASPKWNFQFGKMCADWGGYEFDQNPVEIFEYNDLIENSDNFLTGMQAQYVSSPKHAYTFQVLNSRTKTFAELYGSIPGVDESKFPAAFVGNWRGNFGKGKFTTLWSYSVFLEAKRKTMNYLALGNQLNLKKLTIVYDFKWSAQDIDRTGIVTSIVPDSFNPYAALDVRYVEHWLELRYRLADKWSFQVVGMMSNAYWFGNQQVEGNSHLRTSLGINPTVEYYPFEKVNLRFFATYVQRVYDYTPYATQQFGAADFNTSRISFGFVSPLLIL
ncbi:MAG: hypothetical protein KA713_01005 [Chryseotalea sp. WA131a]|nr:MAG: hypothetical protein KA713_01005 [Chryseotalea sp. WA131a]